MILKVLILNSMIMKLLLSCAKDYKKIWCGKVAKKLIVQSLTINPSFMADSMQINIHG